MNPMLVSRVSPLFALTFVALAAPLAGCAATSDAPSDDAEAVDVANQTEDALAAACSHCVIVPAVSIRGIELGMSKRQVRDVLGAPGSVERYPRSAVFRYGKTDVIFDETDAVVYVSTTSPKVKTRSGVGVGSTKREVLDGVAGSRCFVGPEESFCTVGQEVWRMIFQLGAGNKVVSVSFGGG